MSFDYDLFVIGTDPGGSATAKQAASYDERGGIAEQETIGGTCINRGCIPKKFIVYAAGFTLNNPVASNYGWDNIDCRWRLYCVEFSSMMNAFGVEVTLIDNDKLILSGFDDDLCSGFRLDYAIAVSNFYPKLQQKILKRHPKDGDTRFLPP